MLNTARLYVNLRAPDLDAVSAFYQATLGLSLRERRQVMPGHEELLFDASGGVICFEQGEPAATSSTPVSFEVDDLQATMADLRAKGVTFEEYDLPSLKTTDGVASIGGYTAAWFKDPAGNLLSLFVR